MSSFFIESGFSNSKSEEHSILIQSRGNRLSVDVENVFYYVNTILFK